MHEQRSVCAAYLTSDDVIAATRDCMEDTIAYLHNKCGGIQAYMKTCGLEEWELSQIRVNLLSQAAPKDLLERLRRSHIHCLLIHNCICRLVSISYPRLR